MNVRYCMTCGQVLDQQSNFCGSCGTANNPEYSAAPEKAVPLASLPVIPPSLHWGWVLALTAVTLGVFGYIWIILQWNYVNKVNRSAAQRLLGWLIAILVVAFLAYFKDSRIGELAAILISVWAYKMIAPIQGLYRTKGYAVRLNKILAILFSFLYIQHHFTKLAHLKQMEPGRYEAKAEATL